MLRLVIKSLEHCLLPHVCIHCSSNSIDNTQVLCNKCLYILPFTGFETIQNNEVAKIFWGRIPIVNAFALLFFNKGNVVQNLMHHLKYKHRQEVGTFLGKLMGKCLLENNVTKSIDFILPIPLHPKRAEKRGYNQAQLLGEGIAEITKIPVVGSHALRLENTSTQTKMNRIDRWRNMEHVFEIATPDLFKNKHILIVDDIITTGATIEACARKLLLIEGVKISIASAAIAV